MWQLAPVYPIFSFANETGTVLCMLYFCRIRHWANLCSPIYSLFCRCTLIISTGSTNLHREENHVEKSSSNSSRSSCAFSSSDIINRWGVRTGWGCSSCDSPPPQSNYSCDEKRDKFRLRAQSPFILAILIALTLILFVACSERERSLPILLYALGISRRRHGRVPIIGSAQSAVARRAPH